MILFEDKNKPKTVNIYPLIKDSVFNEIHLIGDSNGYNITSIRGCSPKMITYPNSIPYYKLLCSLKTIKSGDKIRDDIKVFDKLFTDKEYNYIKSYVNRENTIEKNYYKAFIKLLLMSKKEFKVNKNGKMMFERDTGQKNPEIVGFFF